MSNQHKMDTTAVWKKHHRELKRFILSKVRDEQVADDLLQDVFIKVHNKSHQLIDLKKLKPWVYTIARNVVMDFFKRSDFTESFEENREVSHPEEEEDHTELDCLPGIIDQLPLKYKRPLYLADVKGVKQVEIARKLAIALPTVKSQIQRGRKLVIQGYIDCCDYKLNTSGKLVGERKEKANCKVCQ
jgi:RNA polymerase sigma-70 factor (ECF subfamily)